MTTIDTPARQKVAPSLVAVLIGGLSLHGEMTATQVIERAEGMGLGTEAQARAIADLLDQGVASVMRDGEDGKIIAAPGLADLPRSRRVSGIIAYLGQAEAVRHA